MAFRIEGLPLISSLNKGDQVLVYTGEGLKTLTAEVLGSVFSDTSVYDNRVFSRLEELNTQYFSTHDKIRKYLAEDITDEVYFTVSKGKVACIKDTVALDVETGLPLEITATALNGKKMYWTSDPKKARYKSGMPWVTDDAREERVTVTLEETPYPVYVYQYYSKILSMFSVESDEDGNPTLTTSYTTASGSSAILKKAKEEFTLQLTEGSVAKCGFRLSKNPDSTYSAKLIGTWENVNDWDIDDVVKKSEFKPFVYENAGPYAYLDILSVNTANKVKWRITRDTTNKVYSVLEGSTLKVYYSQIQTDSSGTYTQDLVRNRLGNPLYWPEDLDSYGSTDHDFPVFNGRRVYPTTTPTPYPVHVYRYRDIELFSLEYDRGIRLKFSDSGNRRAEISKTTEGLVLRYLSNTGSELSKLVLDDSGTSFSGPVKSEGSTLIGLPTLPTAPGTEYYLSSVGGNRSWKEKTPELPKLPENPTERLVLSYNPESKEVEWVPVSELTPTEGG